MTITLYQHPLSGHSHRVRLLLSLLGQDASIIDVDLANGEHKSPAFIAKNPLGQVPVLEDNSITVSDSNAILIYLASRYDKSGQWYPEDVVLKSEVQRFLSIAAGQIASGPAAARLVNVFGAAIDHQRAKDIAHGVLTLLNEHLTDRTWLVGATATIADVACYAYIAHAPEGDVSLESYPAVLSWLDRVRGLPGFVAMTTTSVGLAA